MFFSLPHAYFPAIIRTIQTMQLCSVEHCSHTLSRRRLGSNWRCAPSSHKPSNPTLLETLATPCNSVAHCSMGHCPLFHGAEFHRVNGPLHISYCPNTLLQIRTLCITSFLPLHLPIFETQDVINKMYLFITSKIARTKVLGKVKL